MTRHFYLNITHLTSPLNLRRHVNITRESPAAIIPSLSLIAHCCCNYHADMSVEIRANAFKALAAALGEKGVANTAVVLKVCITMCSMQDAMQYVMQLCTIAIMEQCIVILVDPLSIPRTYRVENQRISLCIVPIRTRPSSVKKPSSATSSSSTNPTATECWTSRVRRASSSSPRSRRIPSAGRVRCAHSNIT